MGSTIDDEGHTELPYSIAASCAASERLQVVAGADLQPERRQAFGERWGVALYEDANDMVAQEAPDLVAICTTASGLAKPAAIAPDAGFRGDSHAELTIAMAEAGVPMLYVEKAMASSMAMADAARDACEKQRLSFNSGVLRRFDNRYEVVKDAIAAGAIGEPRTAVHFARSRLMHMGIHSIDTLSYLLGDPPIEAVRGELLPRDFQIVGDQIPSDPDATYQLRFANGVDAWSVPSGNWEFEVHGTEGAIRSIENGAGATLRVAKKSEGRALRWEETPFEFVTAASPVVTCLEDLVYACESNRSTRGPVDLSHHITGACIGIAESHRQGGAWIEPHSVPRDLYIFHV